MVTFLNGLDLTGVGSGIKQEVYMDGIIAWITNGNNWTNIVAILWTVDQLLKIIAKMNPEKNWVDNVSDFLGNILARFFPKGS